MQEIERKFLVKSNAFIEESISKNRIAQGYLNTDPKRTVRVRVKGDKGYLTIKGEGNESGTTRFEWEKEIDVNEANHLLEMCELSIEKIRYDIPFGKHTFEVDVFLGDNDGLTIAEVELSDENEYFDKPSWLGSEITGDNIYYNSALSKNPYKYWN